MQADDPALSHWPEERLRVAKRSEEDEDKAETRQQQVPVVYTCSSTCDGRRFPTQSQMQHLG